MPDHKPRNEAERQEAVHTVMHEFKEGELHSGSKEGPQVKNRDQAVAIAMSESGQAKSAPHSFPQAKGSPHGYGHADGQRQGHLRTSGHSGAHRIGKKR